MLRWGVATRPTALEYLSICSRSVQPRRCQFGRFWHVKFDGVLAEIRAWASLVARRRSGDRSTGLRVGEYEKSCFVQALTRALGALTDQDQRMLCCRPQLRISQSPCSVCFVARLTTSCFQLSSNVQCRSRCVRFSLLTLIISPNFAREKFRRLPVRNIIGETITCLHGGLPLEIVNLEQVRRLVWPTDAP